MNMTNMQDMASCDTMQLQELSLWVFHGLGPPNRHELCALWREVSHASTWACSSCGITAQPVNGWLPACMYLHLLFIYVQLFTSSSLCLSLHEYLQMALQILNSCAFNLLHSWQYTLGILSMPTVPNTQRRAVVYSISFIGILSIRWRDGYIWAAGLEHKFVVTCPSQAVIWSLRPSGAEEKAGPKGYLVRIIQ